MQGCVVLFLACGLTWLIDHDVQPLRLIIMSATLRVSDFVDNHRLFQPPPPVINVTARQHPVTIHFNRRTSSDYVTEAIKKASKIHIRLPPGGILIFLTGQNEINGACQKLEAKFGQKALNERRQRRGGGPSRSKSLNARNNEQSDGVAFAHGKLIFDNAFEYYYSKAF